MGRKVPRHVAVGREVCYFALNRCGGGSDGSGRPLNRQQRRTLERISAEYHGSEPWSEPRGPNGEELPHDKRRRSSGPTPLWLDWYAVPCPEGIEPVRRILHTDGFYDGPYWGVGRAAITGSGGGEPVKRKPAFVAADKAAVAAGDCWRQDLLLAVLGKATLDLPSPDGDWWVGRYTDAAQWLYAVEAYITAKCREDTTWEVVYDCFDAYCKSGKAPASPLLRDSKPVKLPAANGGGTTYDPEPSKGVYSQEGVDVR